MRRRGFIRAIGGTALGAMASPIALAGSDDCSRLLVLVELKGGNDGLNTVVPYADPDYYRLRPALAICRDQVLQLDERLGLHPSLAPLMPLWQRGEMAILQGVGYPDPSLSHCRSIEIWDTACISGQCPPDDWLVQALGKNRLQWRSPVKSCNLVPKGAFGCAVQAACEALAWNAGIAVIRLALDGFDTHQNQAPRHAAILGELAEGLSALRAGLDQLGLWDSTLVLTQSEFGRRVAENPSAGTDHGTATVHFAFGGRVRGGLYANSPQLDKLDGNGNLLFSLDFRAIFAAVLDRWLNVPAFRMLGQRFATESFFAA